MCFLCNATQTFEPSRHGEDGRGDFASITEWLDASPSTSTSYSMSVGDTFNGNIAFSGDRDWVAVTLTAGEIYDIDLTGYYSGHGTLADSYLRLYDASGNFITYDDDGGFAFESALTYTASSTGTYYVAAGGYGDNRTGTYRLSVTENTTGTGSGSSEATLDELANYLTDGYWSDTGRSSRRFDTSADNQITVNITALTAAGQQLARWAFEAWERVADIEFVETSASWANITFDDDDSGAYADSTVSNGYVLSSEINVSSSWLDNGDEINSYAMGTYIHEIGHALGLGHQGDYNGSATYGTDETFSNDSWQVSVMSYFDQTENTTVNASYAYMISTMMADIVAIQNLYGAPDASTSETAGNTTWGANTTLTDSYLEDAFTVFDGGSRSSNMTSDSFTLTIYDVGGTDTIDLRNNTTNDVITLEDESFSNVSGGVGNLAIARGTVIENLITGSGNDSLTGNDANNEISAGDGNDTVIGGSGNDSLTGGTSANDLRDMIYGGDGNDSINGGYGNDELRGDAGNDTIEGGFGVDTVIGGVGDDVLTGSAWSDEIYGGAGDDFVNGGFGSDRVNGGVGADRFFHIGIADHGSDWIQDYAATDDDVLVFGNTSATADQFQVNFTETENAGETGVEEAFVIYRPTGQIMWALVDGGAQDEITLRIDGTDYDLLA